jgi:hypothetical protein
VTMSDSKDPMNVTVVDTWSNKKRKRQRSKHNKKDNVKEEGTIHTKSVQSSPYYPDDVDLKTKSVVVDNNDDDDDDDHNNNSNNSSNNNEKSRLAPNSHPPNKKKLRHLPPPPVGKNCHSKESL